MHFHDHILRWLESFLMNRHQWVKIGSRMSEWLRICGTVPQVMLLVDLLFIIMITNLQTDCHRVKYVDDTAISNVSNSHQDNALQNAVTVAMDWSHTNSMKINTTKMKEMLLIA